MPYRLAGIDVHKKMLAVVVADVEVDGDFDFERQTAGTTPTDLRRLADWLVEHEVEESRHGVDRAVLAAGVGSPSNVSPLHRAARHDRRFSTQAHPCSLTASERHTVAGVDQNITSCHVALNVSKSDPLRVIVPVL